MHSSCQPFSGWTHRQVLQRDAKGQFCRVFELKVGELGIDDNHLSLRMVNAPKLAFCGTGGQVTHAYVLKELSLDFRMRIENPQVPVKEVVVGCVKYQAGVRVNGGSRYLNQTRCRQGRDVFQTTSQQPQRFDICQLVWSVTAEIDNVTGGIEHGTSDPA